MKRLFLYAVTIVFLSAAAEPQDFDLTRSVPPSGTTNFTGRQILLEFSRPMTALGDPGDVPFAGDLKFSPPVKCVWRWVDARQASCDVSSDAPLAPATYYKLTLPDGKTIAFETPRPEISYARILRWDGPGMPVFRANSNMPLTLDSIEKNLSFTAKGKKVSVRADIDPRQPLSITLRPGGVLPADMPATLNVAPGLKMKTGGLTGTQNKALLAFHTYPAFKFLGVKCDRAADGRCDPAGETALTFSVPPKQNMKENLSISQKANLSDSWNGPDHARDSVYKIHIFDLKPGETYNVRAKNAILDVFDRPLATPLDAAFTMGDQEPGFDVGTDFIVFPPDSGQDIPAAAVNLDSVTYEISGRNPTGNVLRQGRAFFNGARNEIVKGFLNVKDHIAKAGTYRLAKFSSPALRQASNDKVVAVTGDFNATVRSGRFNTLVLLTDIKTGAPVSGAEVRLLESESDGALRALTGPLLTDDDGLIIFQEKIPDSGAVVQAKKGGKFLLYPLTYHTQVNSDYRPLYKIPTARRIMPQMPWERDYERVWGFAAQGVYRPGDRVDYKIFVREMGLKTLENAPNGSYKLEILNPRGEAAETRERIKLSSFGTFADDMALSESAPAGRWTAWLSDSNGKRFAAFSFIVADFTPSTFKTDLALDRDAYKYGDTLTAMTAASRYAGGPYGDARNRVTASVERVRWTSPNRKHDGYTFDTVDAKALQSLYQAEEKLDVEGRGTRHVAVKKLPFPYGKISVESAVRDEREKFVAATKTADYIGFDRLVGIKAKNWTNGVGRPAVVLAVVADKDGNSIAGERVAFSFARCPKWNEACAEEASCSTTSAPEPAECSFVPKKPGYYKVAASSRDAGFPTVIGLWVSGEFLPDDNKDESRFEMIADKTDVAVGEEAEVLLNVPYDHADVLLTVEKSGVLEARMLPLSAGIHPVRVTVTDVFAPEFTLSAQIVGRPKTDKGETASARLRVTDRRKELKIEVSTDKSVYKPKEKVKASVAVSSPHYETGPVELAVVVLDEAVFDLLKDGGAQFDVYGGLMRGQSNDMRAYSLIRRLFSNLEEKSEAAIPRLIALKSAAVDGMIMNSLDESVASAGELNAGGAKDDARALFKYVAYFNPKVRADYRGRAELEFILPDNLTKWRLVGIAVNKKDLMGAGHGFFATSKPTQIAPAAPNQSLPGDRIAAEFAVTNAYDAERTLDVAITLNGGKTQKTRMNLAPYQRRNVGATVSVGDADMEFKVTAGDSIDSDTMVHKIAVLRRDVTDVMAEYGMLEAPAAQTVRLKGPPGAEKVRASALLSPSVIQDLDASFKYMREYPYPCWEQKLSRAVAAAAYDALKGYTDFSWPDARPTAEKLLAEAPKYQTPSGAMAYYVADDSRGNMYLSAYTAIAFSWLRERGYAVPAETYDRLLKYLGAFISNKTVVPAYASDGSRRTAEAAAAYVLAREGRRPALSKFAEDLDRTDVFGLSFLMRAAMVAKDRATLSAVTNALQAKAAFSAGRLSFNDQGGDWQTLYSAPRNQCGALAALVQAGRKEDALKAARQVVMGRKKNRFYNTQENAVCLMALADYAKKFEAENPNLKATVTLDGQLVGNAGFTGRTDAPKLLKVDVLPDRDYAMRISGSGTGSLYYRAQVEYVMASGYDKERHAGIEVVKTLATVDGKMLDPADFTVKRGDIVRVKIKVSLPAARSFVVVDDHIPGGFEPVNADLATASTVDVAGERRGWGFYHRELLRDAARFYSEQIGPGTYEMEYTLQAVAAGDYALLPAKAMEMYDEDIYGRTPRGRAHVKREQ